MKLIYRIGYYLGGFSIGLVILAFFLNGKKASCSYGPESRVLKNINLKKVAFSNEAEHFITTNKIDTLSVNYILYKGDVVFSKSETKSTPCKTYHIEGVLKDKEAALLVENCEKTATLKKIIWIDH